MADRHKLDGDYLFPPESCFGRGLSLLRSESEEQDNKKPTNQYLFRDKIKGTISYLNPFSGLLRALVDERDGPQTLHEYILEARETRIERAAQHQTDQTLGDKFKGAAKYLAYNLDVFSRSAELGCNIREKTRQDFTEEARQARIQRDLANSSAQSTWFGDDPNY